MPKCTYGMVVSYRPFDPEIDVKIENLAPERWSYSEVDVSTLMREIAFTGFRTQREAEVVKKRVLEVGKKDDVRFVVRIEVESK